MQITEKHYTKKLTKREVKMSDKCIIYILGDICPRWGNSRQFNLETGEAVFHEIKPLICSGDLVIANLESPATNCEEKLPKNSMNLKADPADISVLADAGIHGVALANNHILDYGVEGYNNTVKSLEKYGIFYYGAGNRDTCSRPAFREINGLRIGLIAFAEQEFNCAVDYGFGANLWDDFDGISSIREAKKQCDYLIVQYHGGIEGYIYPSPLLQKKCRAMADAGADLITCQHSHCVGTRESWKNSEILYGQGNCVFGYSERDEQWNRGLIIRVQIDKKVKVEYLPVEACPDGEHLMQTEKASGFMDMFRRESAKIGDPDFIRKNWIRFCEKQKSAYLPMLFAHGRILSKMNRMSRGMVVSLLTSNKARRNTMNLIRCDAHKEIVGTILELDYYRDSKGN